MKSMTGATINPRIELIKSYLFQQSVKYFCLECVFKRIASFFLKTFIAEVSAIFIPLLIFLRTSDT
jgi:hypothetical protein